MHLVCSVIHIILNHWIAILIVKLPHCISITGRYSTGMAITTGILITGQYSTSMTGKIGTISMTITSLYNAGLIITSQYKTSIVMISQYTTSLVFADKYNPDMAIICLYCFYS